ncbi:MAG: metallophosphoesterase [Alphaproteobacteria bacterium]|nr:metallophosphoesterase [Alphaproteobacteria bacterium]
MAELPNAHDLGAIDEPVLVFGGPYGNLEATQALIAEGRRRSIAPARMICTGDVVAYCADPQATVDLIRHAGIPVVMGNCEKSLAMGAQDCGCGFAPGSACDLLSAQWFRCAERDLDQHSRAWMGTRPRALTFELGRPASARRPWRRRADQPICLCRQPSRRETGGARPGGVPMASSVAIAACPSPRSWMAGFGTTLGWWACQPMMGHRGAWYSVLTPRPGDVRIEHLSLRYHHEATAAKMHERGYPTGYVNAICDGLWPICDILLDSDRQSRGRPIAETMVTR